MQLIKIWLLLNMLLFSVVIARGQEQATPRERALMERIGGEVNSNLVCTAVVLSLQDKIKELEAKLKAQDEPK